MHHHGHLTAFVVVVSTVAGLADDEVVTDEQIAALVDQLVSPNEAPDATPPSARYPAGYDRSAQAKVRNAFHKLRKLAPRSFPFLFDHFDDRRYSLTEDAGDFDKNYSVGQLCRDILASYLQSDVWDHKPFGTSFRRRPNQPDYLAHHKLFDPKSAKKWWETRKDKSLVELQTEVWEWVLSEETESPDKYSKGDLEKVRKNLDHLRSRRRL